MIHTTLLAVLFLAGYVSSLKPAKDYFNICHTKDPNIGMCIKKSIEDLRPSLVKGVPELNIVPLDPLFIPKLQVTTGLGLAKTYATFTDLHIYGLRSYEIQKVSVNIKKHNMHIDSTTQNIDLEGDCEIDTRILWMSIKGSGHVKYNLTDVTKVAFIQNEVFKKDGVDYLGVKQVTWKMQPKKTFIEFTRLTSGKKDISQSANKFLNKHWKLFYMMIKSGLEDSFGKTMGELANKVYTLFPKDELQPE